MHGVTVTSRSILDGLERNLSCVGLCLAPSCLAGGYIVRRADPFGGAQLCHLSALIFIPIPHSEMSRTCPAYYHIHTGLLPS